MSTAVMKHFDPIEYTQQLRAVGVSQSQADVQAQAFERVINDIATNQDLATKSDLELVKLQLQKEIQEIESRLIKWVVGTGITGVVILAGFIKYMH